LLFFVAYLQLLKHQNMYSSLFDYLRRIL